MKIKKLFIVLFLAAVFFLIPNKIYACQTLVDCEAACTTGGICISTPGCPGAIPYTCQATGSKKDNVNIGRDFKVGTSPILSKHGYENLSSIFSSILPNIYIIAGIILLFLIIGAGFAIMSSTDDPQKKGQGSKALTAAIVGFLIIFASYWIIQIIEKITGVPILINKIGI